MKLLKKEVCDLEALDLLIKEVCDLEALDLGHSNWSTARISLFLLRHVQNDHVVQNKCDDALLVCQSTLILYQHYYINSSTQRIYHLTISTQWLNVHHHVGCGFWLCSSYMKMYKLGGIKGV